MVDDKARVSHVEKANMLGINYLKEQGFSIPESQLYSMPCNNCDDDYKSAINLANKIKLTDNKQEMKNELNAYIERIKLRKNVFIIWYQKNKQMISACECHNEKRVTYLNELLRE
ncbi:MAG: hypothetical protein QMD14_04960 [Candidatus Aenigmarchaeota archaeon]|nr:hypothetical protein [Candidatus Aenigmarchaeota archaeon]